MKILIRAFLVSLVMGLLTGPLLAQEVFVFSNPEGAIDFLQSKNWWGEANREQQEQREAK